MPLNELNKNPFEIPENYFDRLPMHVQERCAEAQKVKSGLGIWATIKPRLAYVAGFGALALLAYGGFSLTGDNDTVERRNNVAANNNRLKFPVSANSFVNNNAKSYAYLGNHNPVFILDKNENKKPGLEMNVDEDIMNYLALENISAEDILGLD